MRIYDVWRFLVLVVDDEILLILRPPQIWGELEIIGVNRLKIQEIELSYGVLPQSLPWVI